MSGNWNVRQTGPGRFKVTQGEDLFGAFVVLGVVVAASALCFLWMLAPLLWIPYVVVRSRERRGNPVSGTVKALAVAGVVVSVASIGVGLMFAMYRWSAELRDESPSVSAHTDDAIADQVAASTIQPPPACDSGDSGSETPPGWEPIGDTNVSASGCSLNVSSEALYWSGAFLRRSLPNTYVVEGDARVGEGSSGGYGVVVGASFVEGEPRGFDFQYDIGAGGYRICDLPDSEGGTVVSAPVDHGWHHFRLTVTGATVQVEIDDRTIGTFTSTAPLDESEGIYLRTWNSQVELRNLTATGT